LYDRAGFSSLFKSKDLVAIKLHFGERGNTAYIRPQFLRRVVDKVRASGARPFLTDANTLYVGSRSNAVDHLQTAVENGFDYAVVNAPLVIADGLIGMDYETVRIDGKWFKKVKIGSALVQADGIISVAHFKGHGATGFGGTLKNLGMGGACRSGKQMQHSDLLPRVSREKCTACRKCTRWCPAAAINIEEQAAVISEDRCIGCAECTVICPHSAIDISWKSEEGVLQEKMAEYTLGVLKGKEGKAGFISFVTDVSPDCDCCAWNDAPIVPDIGILASKDPIALDQACADLVNRAAALSGSRMDDNPEARDKWRALNPKVDWMTQLEYGERIGLGTRDYRLVKVG
ncbi:MAG: DUF362 domain-containing protein, partial [Actinobacteria bacterium]|nr:DUF362 domain-containing protein [Actinomycetota bacterium]